MDIELKIGSGTQVVSLPDENVLDVLEPNKLAVAPIGEAAILQSLANPIKSLRLRELVKPGEKISIITSDITRPCPSDKILPAVLMELWAAGIKKTDVTVVFALGSHRTHTEGEKQKLVGKQVYSEVSCIDGNPDDFIHLGETSRGTPVDIVRTVAEADRRICIGNIEYHYFAGYSGGAKAIMPGVSTRAAIQANHSMMVQPEACAGKIDGNPIRADIEEAANICGVDFIINVVLDAHKEIVCAVSGDMISAHRVGCTFLDNLYRKELRSQADIVIVSQGGSPKDLNLYQTQKALDNAKHAVKPGGIIILVGSCKEGLGGTTFEEWLLCAKKPEDLIQWIQEDFQLGGHKAAAIALVLQRAEIYLVSDMDPDLVRQIFLKPYSTVQDAVNHSFQKLGASASVIVMPHGGSTLPIYIQQ